MTDSIRVFVNGVAVDVPEGADAGAAVRRHDPALAARLAAGTAYLTDGRGIRVAPELRLAAGAILRVVASARGAGEAGDADA